MSESPGTPFLDSHAHLADPAFEGDLNAVLLRLRERGGVGAICIGESPEAAQRARALAGLHSGFIWFTAGVHPHLADTFDSLRDEERIREFAKEGAVAVGECGLDYHYDNSPRQAQRRAFSAQLLLAAELRLPLVVHTRDADDDTGAMVAEAGAGGVVGVLHCFTGGPALAERALAAGWYISFSGIVTFPKWTGTDVVRGVPDDRILVESDSPYLAPVPHRGRRNEPAWVAETITALAAQRGAEPAALAGHTLRNAMRLFGVAPTTHF